MARAVVGAMSTSSAAAFLLLALLAPAHAFDASIVRAVSLDVTGTLITHSEPVMDSYADAALWARLPNPPTAQELKPAFKQAYRESLTSSPCFGGHGNSLSGREWWRMTIRRVLELCERDYDAAAFERYFRRVYQHFGSPKGYERLADADDLLAYCAAERPGVLLGITSNTPMRHMESVLPMLGLHDHFSWFTCSQDVGVEKPGAAMFEAAVEQARFWVVAPPPLAPFRFPNPPSCLCADVYVQLAGSRALKTQNAFKKFSLCYVVE